MSFETGRVSFTRMRVAGDFPATVDQGLLDIFNEHGFRESNIGTPDETEAGFISGTHIFDTQFEYEKNGYGNICLFGLRIDSHKVPSDVKKAYKMMNEQAMAAGNPSGFASKEQKREAKETADEQVRGELASGKHRKSKMIPILWDLKEQTLYCGTTGSKPIEIICDKMRDVFDADVAIVSSGSLAADILGQKGLTSNYDDFMPSKFTKPPMAAVNDLEDGSESIDVPQIPWIYRATDEKDFLGNEFIMWLWHKGETGSKEMDIETNTGSRIISILLNSTLDMDCAWGATGKQSLRGQTVSRQPEAASALRIGKWPRKIGLVLADGTDQWELTFCGDTFAVSGAKLPIIEDVGSKREFIEARLEHVVDLGEVLDGLYSIFLKERADSGWNAKVIQLSKWIADR